MLIRRLWVVALVAAGVLVAGCGGGPRLAGSAAIVGDQSVPLSSVQEKIDRVLANQDIMAQLTRQGIPPALVAQWAVNKQIRHLLFEEAAKRGGITVDDRQVDAELADPTNLELATIRAMDPDSVRDAARDEVIARALAVRGLDRLSVTADVLTADSKDQALAKARQLAAGPTQAQAVLAADPHAERNRQVRAPVLAATDLLLLGSPVGRVNVLQVSNDAWLVWRVTQRRTDGPPPADPRLAAAQLLGKSDQATIGGQLLAPVAAEIGVRVNPRFGSWDPVQAVVVPIGVEPGVSLPATLS